MTTKEIITIEYAGRIAYASELKPVNLVALEFKMEESRLCQIRDYYWRRFDELLDIMEERVFDNDELREYVLIRNNINKLNNSGYCSDGLKRLLDKHERVLGILRNISPFIIRGNPLSKRRPKVRRIKD